MSEQIEANEEAVMPQPGLTGALQRVRTSRQTAEKIDKELRKAKPPLGDTACLLLGQRAFDLLMEDKPDLKRLVAVFGLVLRHKQQALAERKMDLLQARLEDKHGGRLRGRRKGGLSPETLRQIEEMANIL